MAVDEERTSYEPLDFPDSVVLHDDKATHSSIPRPTNSFAKKFSTLRCLRNERYHTTTSRPHREWTRPKAIRFDIWDRSIDADGVIPYTERSVRPVEYYLNFDFPADLLETAAEVAEEWNSHLKQLLRRYKTKTSVKFLMWSFSVRTPAHLTTCRHTWRATRT